MNTRKYHVHMRIKACIKNGQSKRECVPYQQTTKCYHGMGLVNKHRLIIYLSWNMVKQSRMTNKSTNQSIGHEFTYVGLPPEPILSCLNQFR